MVELDVQHETFAETALTPEELALFNAQWTSLFFPPWSLERDFLNSRMSVVEQGLRAAKNSLDERGCPICCNQAVQEWEAISKIPLKEK